MLNQGNPKIQVVGGRKMMVNLSNGFSPIALQNSDNPGIVLISVSAPLAGNNFRGVGL